VSLFIAAVVVAAAALHAGWNAIAKNEVNRTRLIFRMSIVTAGLCAPLLLFVGRPAPQSWPWLGASVVLHVAYTLLLVVAYRFGDFNQAYPLARGLGPVVVAVFAVVALGERLPLVALAGVALVGLGVLSIGLTPWRSVVGNPKALGAASLTGLAIATYTIIDGIGVRHSGDPLSYAVWLAFSHCAVTAILIRLKQPAPLLASPSGGWLRPWGVAIAAGLMSAVAYGLVLRAQATGALAAVAALRESSVVFAALIGTFLFHEPLGRLRTVASCVIAGGSILLAIDGN
jgi:drug/metabolite transporter (DMT)-like permease